ncbi:hypothetical protein OESDEN_16106 [Oesophagostomum dentatum]|uniref:ABC transmembrane type-1 domain-containing protein n=1 Tax=Oesophagostomum dentatum TaxID=61180 RepID=A0A0B1SH03_OESDE|nr:hypothetical protein OESDEN_16106 [Oesophagostomum dentatum]
MRRPSALVCGSSLGARFSLWNVLRVLFAIAFTAGSMRFANAYFPGYIKATFAAGVIFNMLGEDPRIDGMTKNGRKPKVDGSITLHNVYFKYPKRLDVPILQGVVVSVSTDANIFLFYKKICSSPLKDPPDSF